MTFLLNKKLPVVSAGVFRLLLAFVVLAHHTLGFFGFGAIAVYLFFALSGYWIAEILSAEKKNNGRLFGIKAILLFWVNRLWRLLPLLIATLLITHFFGKYGLIEAFSPQDLSSLDWWLTVLPVIGSSKITGSVGVIWSLDVEAQFYLLAPLIFFILLNTKNKALYLLILLLSFSWGLTKIILGNSATTPEFFTFSFFFLLGISKSIHKSSDVKPLLNTGVMVFFCITFLIAALPDYRNALTNYSAGRTDGMWILQNTYSFIGATLLVPYALNTVRFTGKLDRKVGDFAYPLYLFHYIPVSYYHQLSYESSIEKSMYLAATWAVSLAGTLVLYFLIDRPSEFLRKRYSHKW